MDEFDITSTFREMLKKNLSNSQIQRITKFAYEHQELSDALFATLLNTLVEDKILNRLNLFFTIDSICKNASKNNFDGYLLLVKSHLEEIVYAVVGGDSKRLPDEGLANVNSTRKVLHFWSAKQIFSSSELEHLMTFLKTCAVQGEAGLLNKDHILRRMEEDRDRVDDVYVAKKNKRRLLVSS